MVPEVPLRDAAGEAERSPSHGCFCLNLSQSQAWGCGSVGQQEGSALQHWGDLRLCALPALGSGAAGLTNMK